MNVIKPLLDENFTLGVHPGQWRINTTSSNADLPIFEKVEGSFQGNIWYYIKQFAKEFFRSYYVQLVMFKLNCRCQRGPVNPILDLNARKIFAYIHHKYKKILPDDSLHERCKAWQVCVANLYEFGKLNLSPEVRKEWKALGHEIWRSVERTEAMLKIQPFPLEFESGHTIFTGPAPHFHICMKKLKMEKVKTIVSLLEPKAMEHFELYNGCAKYHLNLISFPIEDMKTPASIQEADSLINKIFSLLKDRNIYIHCMSGKGRTGLIMACITARMNPSRSAQEVMNYTRQAIPGAIESEEQEDFIEAYVEAHSIENNTASV